MRRAVRNLWMTLRATSGLWTTRFGKAADGSPLNGCGRAECLRAGWETYANQATDPTVSAPPVGNVRERTGRRPASKMIERCNLILIKSNRLARHGHQTRERGDRFLLPGGPFHCVRIGVERTAR
jgi:hypothetical protein